NEGGTLRGESTFGNLLNRVVCDRFRGQPYVRPLYEPIRIAVFLIHMQVESGENPAQTLRSRCQASCDGRLSGFGAAIFPDPSSGLGVEDFRAQTLTVQRRG